MNANALILVSLSSNHDVSFVEDKNLNLAKIKAAKFGTPIQQLTRGTDENVISQLGATRNFWTINEMNTYMNLPIVEEYLITFFASNCVTNFDVRAKFGHFLSYLSSLNSQLESRG